MLLEVTRLSKIIGVAIEPEQIQQARQDFHSIVGASAHDYEARKFERDGEEWHITVSMYSAYGKLTREQKNELLGTVYEAQITGIGEHTSHDEDAEGERTPNTVWYATVSSPALTSMMERLGLPARDLHVTLGFTAHDVHGVDKSENTRILTY